MKGIIPFKRNKNNIHPFKVLELDFNNDDVSNVIPRVTKNNGIGVKVKNTFSQNEIRELKDALDYMPFGGSQFPSFAVTWPTSIYRNLYERQLDKDQKISEADELNGILSNNLTFDFQQRIRHILSNLNRNSRVVTRQIGDFPVLSTIQFRKLFKGSQGYKIHCENMHMANCEEFNKRLGPQGEVPIDALSYFLVLDDAEGGELSVFDIAWDWSTESKEKLFAERNVPSCLVSLKAGDMFVFAAGERWHKVSAVRSNKPRVTVGSFLKLNEKNDLEVWI